MIMHSDKKVICVKDIPSNIIEEAIFILKENVINSSNDNYEERSKEIILTEAEEIVDEYINRIEQKNSYNDEDELPNREWIKEAIYITGLLIILGICVFVVM